MPRANVRLFWGFWIILGLLWLVLNTSIFSAGSVFALRDPFLQFSGVLAMAAMSVAMVLSVRPRWPEAPLGGLDKMYRLHKWLGIAVLALAVFHWLWVEAPRWAVRLGLLTRPPRGPRPAITQPLRQWLGSYRGTAEEVGQWVFYALVVLLLVALVRLIPYRWFRYSHRLMPVAYLALVFHAAVLLDHPMWTTPLGPVMLALLLAGSYAAFVSLFGMVGAGRRVAGEIVEMRHYPGVRSLETVIRLGPGWPGHRAGQFAFATSNPIEGAHPYTIASAWDPRDPRVTFISKELGDHTTGLVDRLKLGQGIAVEGPYGGFLFDDGRKRQIWIGAGIGITPFVARLKELAAAAPGGARPEIDLFHTTREVDEAALERLAQDARAADVRLHLLVDARHGKLTGERIRAAVPEWREASFWFCGPARFGTVLRRDFAARGMDVEERFHQELFELR